MKKWNLFSRCIALVTTGTLLANPQSNLPHVSQVKYQHKKVAEEWIRPTTYDEILQMLEDLESGELERRYTFRQLERVNEYLAVLAKEGILPDELEDEKILEEDIYALLYEDDNSFQCAYSVENNDEYIIVPGYSGYDIIQCGKFSHAWKKTKNFVKKHKKEIIIGAVVVVAATVVVVAVVAASSAGTATAVAAGAAGAVASDPTDSSNSESKQETPSSVTASNETPILKGTIDEHVFSFKEFLVEDQAAQPATTEFNDLSFSEKAREVGANLAHQAFDEITDLVKVVPQLCEEVKEIGSKFFPKGLTPPDAGDARSPTENYESIIAKGHETIDKVFSTDQSELFTPEAKANNPMNDFAVGFVPLPGMISSTGTINVKGFSNLGRVSDRAGYTKAGRASMKHGYREGRTVFEKPIGNPVKINEHGQKVLDKILNHPDKVVMQYTNKIYGPVIEIEAPEIGGVRFTGDGKEMMGFLEPKWLKK